VQSKKRGEIVQQEQQTPTCKVCEKGSMQRKKAHRMSGPTVVIGYIFLIPSVLGMLFGLLFVFGSGVGAAESSSTLKETTQKQLAAVNIPQPLIQKVMDRNPISAQDKAGLTQQQQSVLAEANRAYGVGKVGAGAGAALGVGFGLFLMFSSFVGGLLGWILTMKKKILQCGSCGAVVAAC